MKIGVRTALVKWLDGVLGRLLADMLPAAKGRQVAEPRRFLVIRPGGIGDAVLLVPALLALKERFPKAAVTVLAERRNGSVFSLCPAVDRLLLYDNRLDIFKAVRGGYDVVIDTEQWHRLSAVVARFVGASVSIGFATNNRRRLFSRQVDYSQDDYERQSFFHLLAPLGITPPEVLRLPFLTIPEQATRQVADLLAPLSGRRLVAFFTGASIAERRWGAERFRQVALALADGGLGVVVVGGADEVADGDLVVGGGVGLNLAGKTTLAETAAVIARSALLLSGDSGVLHIAVGLGVATVALFGPGVEAKWGPKGEGGVVLNKHLVCSPCTRFGCTPRCATKARCLAEITPGEVMTAVASLTGATSPTSLTSLTSRISPTP